MNTHNRRQKSNKVLSGAQQSMPRSLRLTSILIHTPVVDYTLRFFTSIMFRPMALLYGSSALIIGYAASYFVAKYIGYSISGLEPIVFFGIGWLIGNIQDFLVRMVTGNRS